MVAILFTSQSAKTKESYMLAAASKVAKLTVFLEYPEDSRTFF